MSTHKFIDRICVVILVCTVLLTILFMNGEALGIQVISDQDTDANEGSVWFTDNDLDGNWDSENAVRITLEGTDASIEGSGAYIIDGNLVIASSGTYVVSGELTDGSLIVDANDNSKVWILLNGVSVSCSDNAAFRVDQADKVFLTLAEGTENTFSSGETYSQEALSDNTGGAVFAHDDLTINGTGSLTVKAAYKHGIDANDDLTITGGTIVIEAAADGIHANDSLEICNADLTITAGDDGMVTAGEEAPFYLESGTVTIHSTDDGINTTGDITLAGGSLVITAGDDGIHSDSAFLITDGSVTIDESYEGIEALTIDQQGGDIKIVCSDDGFNANGGSSDQFGMGGGMGGFGREMNTDGESTAPEGETGPRQNTASESQDKTGEMTPPKAPAEDTTRTEGDSSQEAWIHISGGSLTILNSTGRDADGLDSNGDILISGGSILISLTGDGSNSAIDYNSEGGSSCMITGGTVIACGSSSMAEAFDDSSTQCAVLYSLSENAEAGSLFSLLNEDGEVLLSWTVPNSFSSVSFSCPQMETEQAYKIVIGSQEETITLAQISSSFGNASSSMGGGFQKPEDRTGRGTEEESREARMQSGEMPERPDGEMPERPDGEMPERPDGEMPQRPEQEDEQEGTASPAEASMKEMSQAEEDMTSSAGDTDSYTAETYLFLGVSVLVLLAGLAFSVSFKKHR